MKKKHLLSLLFSAAAAICFALFFYTVNTPLGASIGSDNAMYLTMGTALSHGFLPYRNIFDHKGPLLFFLQWLPQAFTGGYSTIAVFCQEVLVLFAALRLLAAIARETDAPEIPAQLIYLALFCALPDGGNLSEEYTAVPTLLGLLAALRCFRSGVPEKGLRGNAFVLGLCTCAAFLTRANNMLPLAGLTAALTLGLLMMRRFPALLACAMGFAGGFLILLVPVCLWFFANGILGDAFYGSIIHNMLYAAGSGNGSGRIYHLLHEDYGHIALFFGFLAAAGALVLLRRKNGLLALGLLGAALCGGYAAFISQKFYIHYLTISLPAAAVGSCLVCGALPKGKPRTGVTALAAVFCLIWLGVSGVSANRQRLADSADLPQFTEDANSLYSLVPEEDRSRFMAYRVEPRWYVVTKALPCMRFYFLQEILADADPAVMDEIVETLQTDPPLWLVIFHDRPFSPPYDSRVQKIFEERYAFVAAAGDYQLLKLQE